MPTLLVKDGFRFFFYSREPQYKPPHVHVELGRAGPIAIFFLEPYVAVHKVRGFSPKDILKARNIIIENQQDFRGRYYEFIKPKRRKK